MTMKNEDLTNDAELAGLELEEANLKISDL